MMQIRLIIKGKVQGVGFRFFIKSLAEDLKINGWVRNTPKGEVEALLQGGSENINEIIKQCKKGPSYASVAQVDEIKEKIEKSYFDFKIIE